MGLTDFLAVAAAPHGLSNFQHPIHLQHTMKP